jgi:hypothetical protein
MSDRVKVRLSIEQVYICVELPLRTLSEANQGGKLKAKLKRKRDQKIVTHGLLWMFKPQMKLPATVRLTRIGPKELDDDNLRGALKWVRDTIAKLFEADDADKRYTWEYAQERRRTYAVRVEITRNEETRL